MTRPGDIQCPACGTWSMASLPVCPGAFGQGTCGAPRLKTMACIADAEKLARELETALYRITATANVEGLPLTEQGAHLALRALRMAKDTLTDARSHVQRDLKIKDTGRAA